MIMAKHKLTIEYDSEDIDFLSLLIFHIAFLANKNYNFNVNLLNINNNSQYFLWGVNEKTRIKSVILDNIIFY